MCAELPPKYPNDCCPSAQKQQLNRDAILGSIPPNLICEILESDDRLFEACGNMSARNIITLSSCVLLTDHVGLILGLGIYKTMT